MRFLITCIWGVNVQVSLSACCNWLPSTDVKAGGSGGCCCCEQSATPGAGRPYWASWMETAVPRGHRSVSISPSHAARWIVRNVPDSRAELNKKRKKWRKKSMTVGLIIVGLLCKRTYITQKGERKWVNNFKKKKDEYLTRLLLEMLVTQPTSHSLVTSQPHHNSTQKVSSFSLLFQGSPFLCRQLWTRERVAMKEEFIV